MSKDKKQTASAPAQPATTAMTPPETNTALAAYDYGDDYGKGFENQGKEDRAIPFIGIVQSLSKIRETNPNAREGMLYNTVTGELYPDGVYVVPAVTQKMYAEFAPPKGTGPFKGQHKPDSDVVKKAKKVAEETQAEFGDLKTDDGNFLVETFYQYVAICDNQGNALSMALIGFKKTQIKFYKRWQTRLGSILVPTPKGKKNPPAYASLWKLGSYFDTSNPKGKYHAFTVMAAVDDEPMRSLLSPDDERFLMGKALHQLVQTGEAEKRVNFASQTNEGGTAEAGGDTIF